MKALRHRKRPQRKLFFLYGETAASETQGIITHFWLVLFLTLLGLLTWNFMQETSACIYKTSIRKAGFVFAVLLVAASDFSSSCVSSLMIYVWSQNKISEVWKRIWSGYVEVWISCLCTNFLFGETWYMWKSPTRTCLNRNCNPAQHLFSFLMPWMTFDNNSEKITNIIFIKTKNLKMRLAS